MTTDRHDAPTEPLPAVPSAWDAPPAGTRAPQRDTPRQPLPAVPSRAEAPRADAPRGSAAAAGGGAAPRARAPISKPSPLIVIGGSFGLFFVITALLAFQMRAGADPAIGAGEPVQVAAATPAPRKVLVRRVIVTRIVEHRPRRDDGGSAPAAAPPRGGNSAPAPSAPAPAPAAPAPAPAPPPVSTQSS
jgi:2-oxoglutarate dehydrogenase E2 component (dihydrolipoamide succinyltransferase)